MVDYLRTLFQDLRNGVRAARRQREMVEAARSEDRWYLEARPKIVRVGELVIRGQSFAIMGDWRFFFPAEINGRRGASLSRAVAYPPTREDLDGTRRIYGYTLAELQEFHARRVEFNVEA